MKIAVIGSGALGLYYGALLQRAGHDLHFLLRNDYEAICQNGLQVISKDGDFMLPKVKGYRDSAEIERVDLILIGLKTTANHRMVELVAPLMHKDVTVLTLQNGLGNEEILVEAFGSDRILGGTAFLCSNRINSGSVHHLDYGSVTIGSYSGKHKEELAKLSTQFIQANIPCTITDNLLKTRWQKLIWNIAFNGMCAHTEKTTAQLLSNIEMTNELRAIMLEVIQALNAEVDDGDPIGETSDDDMITATRKMADYRPSMMIDKEEKRPLELEAIYRIPLEHALKMGVSMPRTSLLHQLLRIC